MAGARDTGGVIGREAASERVPLTGLASAVLSATYPARVARGQRNLRQRACSVETLWHAAEDIGQLTGASALPCRPRTFFLAITSRAHARDAGRFPSARQAETHLGFGTTGTGTAFQVLGGGANGILPWTQKHRRDYLHRYAHDSQRQRLYARMIPYFSARVSGMCRLREDPFTGLPSSPEVFWLARSNSLLAPPIPHQRP